MLPLGGSSGAQLSEMLTRSGIAFHPVPINDSIRGNISLAESDGTVTKINESGSSLTSMKPMPCETPRWQPAVV